jgi:hypothetical protein
MKNRKIDFYLILQGKIEEKTGIVVNEYVENGYTRYIVQVDVKKDQELHHITPKEITWIHPEETATK